MGNLNINGATDQTVAVYNGSDDPQAAPPVDPSESSTKVTTLRTLAEDVPDDEAQISAETRKSAKVWACAPDRTLFWSSTPTEPSLLPGLYKCTHTQETGYALRKLIVSTDDLIAFDDDAATSQVRAEIIKFWKLGARYKSMGMLHKRGILMFGDPGSGKTSVIQQLIAALIKDGGIAIYADDPNILTGCLQMIRRIEPNRPIAVILEDFETLTERQQRENEWLSVLDGESQINNVVFLATTNYIQKLDKRFTDRPSRFDTIMKVPMPGAKTRAVYLMSKLPFMPNDGIRFLVGKTGGLSIAHLKELIVSTFCLNEGETMSDSDLTAHIEKTLARLREMQNRRYKEEDAKGGGGFGFQLGEVADDTGSNLDYEDLRKLADKFLVRTGSNG